MFTKNQLIVSCLFNGGNFIFLIYYIYDIIARPTDLEHITRWSYYLNSIFTTICLYCDIMGYYTQEDRENIENEMDYNIFLDDKNIIPKNKLKLLNDWNRNKFGVICNTLCYFVSIGFWFLFIFGNNYMSVSKGIKSTFNCIYHHIIIQIITIIDIFNFKRKIHYFSWFYFGIIYSIFILYCIIISLEKNIIGRYAYHFMDGSSSMFLILCLIISSVLLFISYLIHIFLVALKNNNKKQENLLDDIYSDKESIEK